MNKTHILIITDFETLEQHNYTLERAEDKILVQNKDTNIQMLLDRDHKPTINEVSI